ncbi:TPA: ATP-binding cassette domain-containing protein, partial [Bacillus cereus]|nr:ATP-binding cassette domain-containing protein [Bacillus cereus]
KLSIQEIKDIAIQTDIIEYLSKNVGELSSGMKQKVSLTCALLHNPEFLILDEPFNALDVFATSVLSDILKKWSKGILFTSHIPETVYNLADRVIVLKNGYIHHDVKISSFKNINEFENWVKGHISIKNRASSSDGNSENGTNIKTPKLPIL